MQYLSQTTISPSYVLLKLMLTFLEVIPGNFKGLAMSIPNIDYSKFFGSSHKEQHLKTF
jgi:hypothetical protein